MSAMLKINYNLAVTAVGKWSKGLTCIKVAYQIAKILESRSVGGLTVNPPKQIS